MVPNEEIFETLESYIDGALDTPARAKVEKQLAANPQLRKLVAELLETRNMLRQLPRASAPTDLAETFQGSLERSALLGEDGPAGSDVVFRINRWPQIMSVAAIVLMAVGLAAIIYKVVLPQKHPTVAVSTPAGSSIESSTEGGSRSPDNSFKREESADGIARNLTPEPSGGGGRGSTADRERAFSSKMPAKSSDEPVVVSTPTAGPLDLTGTPAMQRPMKPTADSKVAVNFDGARPNVSADDLQMAQKKIENEAKAQPNGVAGLGMADQLANEPLVLVIKAQDPRQANEDVTRYFALNHIEFVALGDTTSPDYAQPSNQVAEQEGLKQPQQSAGNLSASNTALNGGRLSDNNNSVATNGVQQSLNRSRAGGDVAEQQQRPMARNSVVNDAANNSTNLGTNANNDNAIRQQEARGGNYQNVTTSPSTPQPQTPGSLSQQQERNWGFGSNNGNASQPASGNGQSQSGYGVSLTPNGGANPRVSTYRTVLTRRQIQQFKDDIARRDNEWTEERTDSFAETPRSLKSDNLLASTATGTRQASAAAQDESLAKRGLAADPAGAITNPTPTPTATPAPENDPRQAGEPRADRRKSSDSLGMKSKADQDAQPDNPVQQQGTTQPALPTLIANEPADKSSTTRPASTDLGALALNKAMTDQAPAAAGPDAYNRSKREALAELNKDTSKAIEARQAAENPTAAASATTQPAQIVRLEAAKQQLKEAAAPAELKVTADDLPRIVLIVVNNQPMNLPIANEPATPPAASTAPAAKPADAKPADAKPADANPAETSK